MRKITIGQALALIEKTSQRGKIFSAVFTKKNDSDRHIVCRRKVGKGLKGKGLKFDPKSKGLLGVYEMLNGQTKCLSKQRRRFIALDKLKAIRVESQVYVICEAA